MILLSIVLLFPCMVFAADDKPIIRYTANGFETVHHTLDWNKIKSHKNPEQALKEQFKAWGLSESDSSNSESNSDDNVSETLPIKHEPISTKPKSTSPIHTPLSDVLKKLLEQSNALLSPTDAQSKAEAKILTDQCIKLMMAGKREQANKIQQEATGKRALAAATFLANNASNEFLAQLNDQDKAALWCEIGVTYQLVPNGIQQAKAYLQKAADLGDAKAKQRLWGIDHGTTCVGVSW